MKKMRCTSCGAELKVKEDKEYAVCEHCGSSYKLNEDVNINIKMDDNTKEMINQGFGNVCKFSKFMFIPVIIFALVFIGGIAFTIIDSRSFDKESKQIQDEYDKEANKAKEESEKYSFNFQFVNAAGTNYGNQLEHTLDDIIESNKNYDRKVTLVFDGESTTDESKIIEIKHGLGSWDEYEVIVNKDADGYINEIKVDKIG